MTQVSHLDPAEALRPPVGTRLEVYSAGGQWLAGNVVGASAPGLAVRIDQAAEAGVLYYRRWRVPVCPGAAIDATQRTGSPRPAASPRPQWQADIVGIRRNGGVLPNLKGARRAAAAAGAAEVEVWDVQIGGREMRQALLSSSPPPSAGFGRSGESALPRSGAKSPVGEAAAAMKDRFGMRRDKAGKDRHKPRAPALLPKAESGFSKPFSLPSDGRGPRARVEGRLPPQPLKQVPRRAQSPPSAEPPRTSLPQLDAGRPLPQPQQPSTTTDLLGAWGPQSGGGASREGGGRWSAADGYECLVASLDAVLPTVGADCLSARWRALGEWVAKFHNEDDAEALAVKLQPLINSSAMQGVKASLVKGAARRVIELHSVLRAARALDAETTLRRRIGGLCVATDQLLAFCGRIHPCLWPVAKAVRIGLYSALFVSGGDAVTVPIVVAGASNPAAEVLEEDVRRSLNSYARRRPWQEAAQEYRKQLGIAESGVLEEEIKREKIATVLGRGIEFWQWQLQKVLVRGWRAQRHWEKEQQKERAAHAKQLEELKAACDRDKQKAVVNAIGVAEARHEELMQQELLRTKALRDECEHAGGRLTVMTQERDSLRERLAEQGQAHTAKVAELESELQAMRLICKELISNTLEGDAWTVSRQEEATHAAGIAASQPSRTGEQLPPGADVLISSPMHNTLLGWLNVCVRMSGWPQADARTVKGFSDAFKLLDAYMLGMHYMSPKVVSKDVVASGLAKKDALEKADIVLHAASLLDIVFPRSITKVELAHPDRRSLHVVIVSSMLQRFADPLRSQACLQAPLEGADDSRNPLWPEPGPKTAADWRARAEAARERKLRWTGTGALAGELATDLLLEELYGNQSPETEAERAQRSYFVSAPFDPIAPLLDVLPKHPDTREREVAALRSVLSEHYRFIRRSYLYYSTADLRSRDIELSTDEVWKLLTDAKLVGRTGLSRTQAEEMFRKSNDGGLSSYDPTLNPGEYGRLLVRLANQLTDKSRRPVPGMSPLTRKLQVLLRDVLAPNLNYVELREFRAGFYSKDAQGWVQNHSDLLAAVFRAFCTEKRPFANSAAVMTFNDYNEFITSLNIIDSTLTHDAARQVFLKMQDLDKDAEAGLSRAGDHTLAYHEYMEVIGALAMFKSPAPYLPAHRRIARFFELWFVPTFTDARRFPEVARELRKAKERAQHPAPMPSADLPPPPPFEAPVSGLSAPPED